MASAVLTIPDEVKAELKRFSWVNWSEFAREELIKQEKRMKLFEELTKGSSFREKDALELGRKINKSLHRKYEEMFKGE